MFRDSMSVKQRPRGFGLPAAIFIITVLAMVVASITRLDEASSVGFGQDLNSIRAFYAAESGAQIALARRFAVAGAAQACAAGIYTDNSGLAGLNQCSVNVDCSQVIIPASGDTYYTFVSTATCGSGIDAAQRDIEVRARD